MSTVSKVVQVAIAILVIFVLFAALGYHITSSKSIDIVIALVATALVVAIVFWYSRRNQEARGVQ